MHTNHRRKQKADEKTKKDKHRKREQYVKKELTKQRRRSEKIAIHNEDYDAIAPQEDPMDWWAVD